MFLLSCSMNDSRADGRISVQIDGSSLSRTLGTRAGNSGEVYSAVLSVSGMTPLTCDFSTAENPVLTVEEVSPDTYVDMTLSINKKSGEEVFYGTLKNFYVVAGENNATIKMQKILQLDECPESGTYLVRNAAGLLKISEWSNDASSPASFDGVKFIITSDIAIAESWTPIGANATGFKGTLDGDGHVISVPMTNFVEGEDRWSGITGYNKGTVENIIYWIEGSSENDAAYARCMDWDENVWTGSVGGIAANNYGTIRNCWNKVNMETPYLRLGGIAGWNYGTIENCINTGNLRIYNSAANRPRVGGIAGATEIKYDSQITNCVSYGTVGLKEGYNSNTVDPVIGGICGDIYYPDNEAYRSFEIRNCFFAEGCFTLDVPPNIERILTLQNGVENNFDNCQISGCGTISATYAITAGTEDNCGTTQTLTYGSSLLNAMNGYVNASNDPSLRKWKTEAGGRVILNF